MPRLHHHLAHELIDLRNDGRIKSRIVDKHLGYEVTRAVNDAMKAAQEGFAKVLSDQVSKHIAQLAAKFKIAIT